jgi:hypothetical protein
MIWKSKNNMRLKSQIGLQLLVSLDDEDEGGGGGVMRISIGLGNILEYRSFSHIKSMLL